MSILFSNPPWWVDVPAQVQNGRQFHLAGVRAGSRWPFTSWQLGGPDAYQFGGYLPYPFFMGYATSYVAAKTNQRSVFRDSIALRESYASYFRFLDGQKFEWIVIESASPSWEHDCRIIQAIKKRHPQIRVALTGPIVSAGHSLFDQAPIEVAIKGEYEKGLVRALNGERGIIDYDLLTLEEMNAAPPPYFDSVHAHRYWDGNPIGSQPPQGQLWSSRGCPYKCIFCVWPATMTGADPDGSGKRTVRHYSENYMEAFLTDLTERYCFKTLYFDDDTFNLGDRHVAAMCRVMRKLGVPWSAMCRADTISPDLWREMKESGCFGVKIGFESGNQYVVDKIVNKRLDLEKARETALFIKSLGMTLHGTFTFGLPGETTEQMADTQRYIESIPFDSFQQSGCAEIEGTPLHTLAEGHSIKNYNGAVIDGGYMRDMDGAQKLRRMASALSKI